MSRHGGFTEHVHELEQQHLPNSALGGEGEPRSEELACQGKGHLELEVGQLRKQSILGL